MTPREVLAEIRSRGIQLKPIGHRLRAIGPLRALDEDLRARFAECRDEILDLVMAEDTPDETPVPMTNVQQRMHLNSDTSNGADHVRAVFEVQGTLDEAALASAAQALTQFHPMLRMRFHHDDGRTTQILGPHTRIDLEHIDTDEGRTHKEAIDEFINRPFRVAEEPLLRIGLTGVPEDDRRTLAVVTHHALADGEALGLLLDELAANYATFKSDTFPEPPHSDREILEQIRIFNEGTVRYEQSDIDEWLTALGTDAYGSLPPCDEGVDGADQPSFERISVSVDTATKNKIDALLASQSVSRLSLLIATLAIIITRTTGNRNCTVGLAVSDRQHQILEQAIANLAKDLPVRIEAPANATGSIMLKEAKRAVLAALDRPSVPLEALIATGALPPLGRRRLRLPIAVAAYERQSQRLNFGDVELHRTDDTHPNPFIGLGLRLVNTSEALSVFVEWDESILTRDRAQQIANGFIEIAKAIALDPDTPIEALPLDDALCQGIILEPAEQQATESRNGEMAHPSSLIESHLASIWSEMLGIFPIKRTDRFFAIGGNSLQIIRMIDKIDATLGVTLSIAEFMDDPMLADLAKRIDGNSESLTIPPAVWLNDDRDQPKIFCLAGVGGLAAFSYRGIADALEGTASLIGVQLPGVGAGGEAMDNVNAMALWVRDTILKKAGSDELICIVGYSAGGIIAVETAKLLLDEGHLLRPVILIDTLAPLPKHKRGLVSMAKASIRRARYARRIKHQLDNDQMLDLRSTGGRLEQRLRSALDRTRLALMRHQISEFPGAIELICSESPHSLTSKDAWERVGSGGIESRELPFPHLELMNEGSGAMAEAIKETLD